MEALIDMKELATLRSELASLRADLAKLRAVAEATEGWLEGGSFQPGDGSPRHAHRVLRSAGLLSADHECPVCPYDRAPALSLPAAVPDETRYPCARCGKTRTRDEGGTTFAVCDTCWDATMKPAAVPPVAALRWTREVPTAAGWYWARLEQSRNVLIVEIAAHERVGPRVIGEWAGPLPEPEEP